MMRIKNLEEIMFVSFPKNISCRNIGEIQSTMDYLNKEELNGKSVIFDFQKMDAFDDNGIKKFIDFMKKLKEKNVDITFVGVKDHIVKLFNTIGFKKIFPIL